MWRYKIISKRKSFKKKDNINAEPRKPSGFTKPMDVPPNFKNFFSKNILITEDPVLKEKYGENFNINDQHPRTTLTGIVFAYIRSKELYTQPKAGEKLNKRLIRLDQPLKELFNVTNNEINGFKDFQTHMGNLYPKKPIYDIPGFPSINAEHLIENLVLQGKAFNPTYYLGQQVNQIERKEGGFLITTSKDIKIQAKAIIIAAGSGAFVPNRPPLDYIEQYENKSVFYLVTDPNDFKDKNIVIAGGGDSAIDWTIILASIAKKVYLVHRRDKFRAFDEQINKVKELANLGKIEMVIPYQLHAIKGTDGALEEIEVIDFDSNIRSLKADILLPFFGLAMDLGPILNWGLNINNKHIEVDPINHQTNIENIYAVGDVASYPGKLKLILTGFAEIAKAMHDLYPKIHNKTLHFQYSTNKGIPSAG